MTRYIAYTRERGDIMEAGLQMTTNTGKYRVIWGWSAFTEYDDILEARQQRDALLSAGGLWEHDELRKLPAIFARNESGYFLAEVR